MAKQFSDIGLVGLAVMGQNLALNIADHGFQISVFNRTTEKTDKFVAENPSTPGGVVGTKTLEEFVASLAKPRKIVILVQAGKGTDAVIDGLTPLLEKGDIVIDGGNSLWTDTIRREKALQRQGPALHRQRRFRRRGGRALRPSLMPGGDFAGLAGAEADLGGHRREGGRRRPASRSRARRPASPSWAACPARPTSARTARATT